MTRGFVTIATGNIHYYKIAANLLKSYRLFTKDPMPFAIIAEEENEYTALFDTVVITTEARRSFLDKFLLLKLCPYDENIFFDADSLAFGDLNNYWDFFAGATDFSSLGENFPLEVSGGAWYDIDGIGDYAQKITYKTRVHMGVCFIRKGESALKLYEDCMELYHHYDQLYFHTCSASVDECVLGLAMPLNNMLAIPEDKDMMGCYPFLTTVKANAWKKQLSYTTQWKTSSDSGILVHWGTRHTHRPLYRFNADCINLMSGRGSQKPTFLENVLYNCELKLLYYHLTLSPKWFLGEFIEFAYRMKERLLHR